MREVSGFFMRMFCFHATEKSTGIVGLRNIAYIDFVRVTPDMLFSYLGIFYMHGKKVYEMCN